MWSKIDIHTRNSVSLWHHKVLLFYDLDPTVWNCCRSGLEQEDMRIIYKYLITSLFPSYQDQELQTTNSVSPSRNSTAPGDVHYGK
jgi:hypothetical protein